MDALWIGIVLAAVIIAIAYYAYATGHDNGAIEQRNILNAIEQGKAIARREAETGELLHVRLADPSTEGDDNA